MNAFTLCMCLSECSAEKEIVCGVDYYVCVLMDTEHSHSNNVQEYDVSTRVIFVSYITFCN